MTDGRTVRFLCKRIRFTNSSALRLFELIPVLVTGLSIFFVVTYGLRIKHVFVNVEVDILRESRGIQISGKEIRGVGGGGPNPFNNRQAKLCGRFIGRL